MEEISADTENIFNKVDDWIDGFFRLLPNMAVALVVFLIFIALAIVIGRWVRGFARSRGRDSLGEVAGSLVKWAIVFLGLMLTVTIVLPSVRPGDLIAGLGIGSVAIGFAFKDILQNMLAGILILLRQPFEVGDQIISGGHEGTVERIETRATFVRTYDGRSVVIPNTDIYTDAVVVNTAYDHARSEYDVGIGYGDDIRGAKDIILDTVKGIDGVLADPPPEVLVHDLAASWVTLQPRWWTKPVRRDKVHVRSAVIEAIKYALDEAGIDMPFETAVHLLHNQTEETDGERGSQREGWPATDSDPKPARLADRVSAAGSSEANAARSSKER